MEILETKGQLECHCCCSSNDVFICELDNCEYPLCSTCSMPPTSGPRDWERKSLSLHRERY